MWVGSSSAVHGLAFNPANAMLNGLCLPAAIGLHPTELQALKDANFEDFLRYCQCHEADMAAKNCIFHENQ